MDPFSISLRALGVVEKIAKLVQAYDTQSTGAYLDDILGELTIFQNVLAESTLMMKDMHSDAPYSAHIALERCQAIQQEMESLMASLDLDGSKMSRLKKTRRALRLMIREDDLQRVCASFKSAITLFRDITTNAMTHDLLRGAYDVESSFDDNMTIPRSRESRVLSAASIPSPRVERTHTGMRTHSQTLEGSQDLNPSEKLSLFDGTISYIAHEAGSAMHDGVQDAFTCACGQRRVGKWFTVRGKYDSGANADFVSDSLIARAGLEGLVVQSGELMELKMFGTTFSFDKTIKLSWQVKDEESSFTQDFWIAPNTNEFDLIIGEPWMIAHGYGRMDSTKSRRKAQFFGMLKLARKPKEQKQREKEKAKALREAAVSSMTNGGISNTLNLALPTPATPGVTISANSSVNGQSAGPLSISTGLATHSSGPSTPNGGSSLSPIANGNSGNASSAPP